MQRLTQYLASRDEKLLLATTLTVAVGVVLTSRVMNTSVAASGLLVIGVLVGLGLAGYSVLNPRFGLFVTVALMPLEAAGRIVPSISWLTMSKIVLVAAAVGWLAAEARHVPIRHTGLRWLLGLTLGAGVSAALGGFNSGAAAGLISVAFHATVLVMVADLVRTPDDYRGLLTGIALGSIPVLIFVIADLISGRSFLGTEPTLFYGSEAAFELGIRRVTSTFYDPNALGRYLAFVSISSLGLLVRSPRRSITLLVSALVVAQVGALLVTSSRGALLALAFGIVTMIAATLVWGRRRIRVPGGVILLLTLGVGGLVAVLSPVILERLSQALEGDARLTLLSGGLKIAQSRPLFGFGIGHVEEAMTPVLGRPMATHNLYLEVLLAFGGIGLILFLGYTGSILARGLAEFRRNGSAQMLTAIASLTAMLVMGLTLHGIQADEPWLAIGLCAAAAHLTRDEHSVQNAPAQPPR